MRRIRGRNIGWLVVGLLAVTAFVTTKPTFGADFELSATLDGRPIPVEEVGKHFCDDFEYPLIRCYSTRLPADARATLTSLLTATDYVTIYDGTNFTGAYMNVSEDYGALTVIGWNDRIGSFKGRNNETGTFYIDWFYGGSWWAFCCNTGPSTLGSYNNSFSSIEKT